MRVLLFFLLLFIFADSAHGSNGGDCYKFNIPLETIYKSCKSIVDNTSSSKSIRAKAATRAAMALWLDEGDHLEIIGFYLIAAESGNSEAYSHIGDLFRNGYKKVSINYEKALEYYRLDTTTNETKLYAIGTMQIEGHGMEKDLSSGISNLKLAFLLGRSGSASALCRVFGNPRYGNVRVKLAYYWCSVEVMEEKSPKIKALSHDYRNKIGMSLSIEDKREIEDTLRTCPRFKLTECDKRFSD